MLTTLLACSLLSGCSSDMLAPGSRDGASATVNKNNLVVNGPVSLTIGDSTLAIGDTTHVFGAARNTRTNRDVTHEVKWIYTSSDTSVVTVDRRGFVTAKANGTAVITASNVLGVARSNVTVSVALDATGITDTPAVTDIPIAGVTPIDLGIAPPFNAPMLPAASVDVSVPRVTGRTIRVVAGDNAGLQSALNAAVGGDEVVLPNNAEYVGNFTLPKHSGAGIVIVRSESVATPEGQRLVPSAATTFARIITPNVAPAIGTESAAQNWHLMGLSISLRPGAVDNYGIVTLGSGTETALAQFVSNIILDRVMISGGETGNSSRCVGFNGNALAVVNSWLAECHAKGRDAQAIGGWTGLGPFRIENNHLEGSGQAVMFGGSDPAITDVNPSDITIRGNHLYKPMSWGGGRWTVKAAFELKNAKRVLFEGNVIENHWADAQVGFAILFQAANQDGGAPWSKLADITVRNNIIRNSTSGFNLLSRVNNGHLPDTPTRRVLVRNNLFVNVGKDPVSGSPGRYLQLMSDHEDVTVMQNTFVGDGANNAVMLDGEPDKRLMLFNNVFGTSAYGIIGSGFGEGIPSLAQFAPGAFVEGNALAGKIERIYPARNSFPATITVSDFTNASGNDYTLRATVAYSANGGTIVGVNGAAILNAVRTAVSP